MRCVHKNAECLITDVPPGVTKECANTCPYNPDYEDFTVYTER